MTAPRGRLDRGEWIAAAAPALAFALVLGAAMGLLALTLPAAERATLWARVEPGFAVVVLVWFLASLVFGALARRAWLRHAAAPGRLAEQVRVQVAAGAAGAVGGTAAASPQHSLAADGSAGSVALAAAVNALVAQRDTLRDEIAARVAAGSREVEQERSRLAALMAELTQSVVVCNLDGRILLFNARARLQFRALAEGPAIGGAEPIGLGRSIYAVLDRRLVAHALEAVQQRLARGAANPSAQFVTATRGGQLLRVQLAPVREIGAPAAMDEAAEAAGEGPAADAATLNGFVLMLDNITREMAEERGRERVLHLLTEGSRGGIANLQAAVELLEDPQLDAATRERFLGVIRDEIGALARRLDEAATAGAEALRTRWPLEDIRGGDFLAAASRSLQAQAGCRVSAGDIDAELWLRVESYSLIQVLLHLAVRLKDEYGVQRLQLRLTASDEGGVERAQLDLVFAVQAVSTETVVGWETEPLQDAGGATSGATTLRDVVQRHGGAFWFERGRPSMGVHQQAFFRFLLPLAGEAPPLEAEAVLRHASRPEFYDFNLFDIAGAEAGPWAERRLADLAYTVFDTETTGLEPGRGDEIVQLGAVRIVAARLRRQETFEQLVDPRRELPAAGIAIHGIRPEMLAGQPSIEVVLPAFHAFAHDSVLVAHNAAFDMRFLQLKEQATGVRFEQPVLDTLLLSALIHPQQPSHRLEAIAERFSVPVLGRHTALGDAIVTAEVFLRMIPLLEAAGIVTLGQALEASRRTWLARVSY